MNSIFHKLYLLQYKLEYFLASFSPSTTEIQYVLYTFQVLIMAAKFRC